MRTAYALASVLILAAVSAVSADVDSTLRNSARMARRPANASTISSTGHSSAV